MPTIRAMTDADLPAIAGIIDATGLFPSDMLPDMTAGYLSEPTEEQWWVIESDNATLGVAYCAPERMTKGTWNLLAIAVHPDNQGQGLGYKLIDHCRRDATARGAHLFLIETADIPAFEAQRALYISAGLKQLAHIPDFYEPGVGKVVLGQALP